MLYFRSKAFVFGETTLLEHYGLDKGMVYNSVVDPDPHRMKIRICIRICIKIRIKVISWSRSRIQIRIILEMTSQNVWNMSLFSRVGAFIQKLGSESGSGLASR